MFRAVRIWGLCLLASALTTVLALAPSYAVEPSGLLRGPAFTDPSRHVEMPSGWVSGPIKHEPWAGDAVLAVTLDQHLYPALKGPIKEFADSHGVKIAVGEGTCGISAGMVSRKAVDIAGYCCPPGDSDRLPGLVFHTIAVAPLAILVNSANPLESLTAEQVRGLFMGNYMSWSELVDSNGKIGQPLPVLAVGRLHCKMRPGHWRLILDNEDLFSLRMLEVGVIPDMISAVSTNPGAIGFETMLMVRRYDKDGGVRELKVNGISPEDGDMLVKGKYPFYRTYDLTTWSGDKVSNPLAAQLVDYLRARVKTLDPVYGLVPVSKLKDAGWKFRGDELVGEPE